LESKEDEDNSQELVQAYAALFVQRWLQGPDRVAVFHRFLTEQWTPSQLAANALPT